MVSSTPKAKIQETLDRILASPAFRKSEQCQRFLRFVVEHREEPLKERTIGTDVFGRPPDYDTSEDPVVRVRATEVRKRLAQYYSESPHPEDVRFEIPSGAYHVELHRTAAKMSPKFWWIAAIPIVLLAWWVWPPPAPDTPLDRFWAPVHSSGKPVLLYCGQPVAYFLSREVHERYRASMPAGKQRGSYVLPLAPDDILHGRDVIPVTDQFVGIGNAHTAALLSGMLARRRTPVEIRYANDLSFSDLRSGPSVLIGAFSNLWTLEMQDQLRFVFEQDKGARCIRDKTGNQTWQLPGLAPDGKTPEDYALVSRLLQSGTGHLLITAAGITQYGTRAAGEFLTSGPLMQEVFGKLPAAWPQKNIQVLLHTTVYRGTPATPTVLSSHVW